LLFSAQAWRNFVQSYFVPKKNLHLRIEFPMSALAKPLPVWLARSRAWISIILLAPATIAVLFSAPWWPLDGFADFACNCLGWTIFFGGAAFRWWATLYIGGKKNCEVIDQGAYSVCRNPLYFGTFLLVLSIAAFLQSLVFLLATLIVAVYYLMVTVPVEENWLVTNYGDAYLRYRERVPPFFPRFSLYKSPAVLEVRISGMYAELRRTARWILIPIICQLVTHFRGQPWWPHWANIP
jgi:protein-S-isoprenylcysteine O-methyltransferase Ste14